MPAMRLRLTIRRHRMMDIRILWSLEEVGRGDFGTVAHLLHRVDEMFGLTNGTNGLEEYTVEFDGFECLHFSPIATILKDNDEVVIRPFNTYELRNRRQTGRLAISYAGAPIVDGVVFGRRDPAQGGPPRLTPLPQRSYITNTATDPASYADFMEHDLAGDLDGEVGDSSPELPGAQSNITSHQNCSTGMVIRNARRRGLGGVPPTVRFGDESPPESSQPIRRKRSRAAYESGKFKFVEADFDSDPTYATDSSTLDSDSDSDSDSDEDGAGSDSGSEDSGPGSGSDSGSDSDSDSDSGPECLPSRPLAIEDSREKAKSGHAGSSPSKGKQHPKSPETTPSKCLVPPGQGKTATKKRNARRRAQRRAKGQQQSSVTDGEDQGEGGDAVESTDPVPPAKRQRVSKQNQDRSLVPVDQLSCPLPEVVPEVSQSRKHGSKPTPDELKALGSTLILRSVECHSNKRPPSPTFPFIQFSRAGRTSGVSTTSSVTQSHTVVTQSAGMGGEAAAAAAGGSGESSSDLDSDSTSLLGSDSGSGSDSDSDSDSDSGSDYDSGDDSDSDSDDNDDESKDPTSDIDRQLSIESSPDPADRTPAKIVLTAIKGDYSIPHVPKSTNSLPKLVADQVRPGSVIVFKQLECSERTEWQPRLSVFMSARVLRVTVLAAEASATAPAGRKWKHPLSNPLLTVRLAPKYVPVKEIKYDSKGGRIYGQFEMEGCDDHLLEEPDDGTRELQFSELFSPMLMEEAA